ncbi:iron ABC transporter permease [Thalassolituus sp.]|uniref:FecCD family ABC transporter permease n=1 Tax=Thalassolituus sp. TaxID=2030822 RepID=UPI002612ADC1|nr:iron ABC transporter permease [uncultured Thalassolituus sp.]
MTGLALRTAPGTSLPGKATLALTALCSLLLLVAVWALLTGPMTLQVNDIFASVWRTLQGESLAGSADWVVRELRLPRVVLAMLVGAGLAVAGCVTQGVFRNPLADPGLIGVSSGAALAAVSVIVLSATWLQGWKGLTGPWALPLAAFAGGLLVTLVIYRLGTRQGKTQVALLLLAGIAINVLAGAATGVLTYMADDQQLRDMTFWSMGSLANARWTEIGAVACLIGLPLILVCTRARVLNAMLMGEQVAGHLGFPVQREKRLLLGAAALMVGAGVAVSGMIGFIGLVVPHLLRLSVGPDHRSLLPLSAIAGALLLLVADTLARTVMAPADLPVGLLMALIGGPVFLILLVQQSRKWI